MELALIVLAFALVVAAALLAFALRRPAPAPLPAPDTRLDAVLSGQGFSGGCRRIISPPLIGLLLALTLNCLSIFFTLPGQLALPARVLMTVIHGLGQCAIPVALLLIGAIVADHLSELRGNNFTRVIVVALLVRLVVMPVLFLLLAKYLPCSLELKRVIIIEGAIPAAVLPVALAKHYGGDTRTALVVVMGTSLAGLITIPLWIQLGGKVLGL